MDKVQKPREEFRILLINPPYPGKIVHPTLSLGYLGAMSKKSGSSVFIWDKEVRYSYKENFNEVIRFIDCTRPDLIGFTLTTPFVYFAYELLDRIKNQFSVPVIAGGPHVAVCPKEVLENAAFEIAVIGEGEYAIVDIIKYFRGELGLKDIPGIVYKDSQGNTLFNNARPFVQNLDELPDPLYPQAILHNNKGGIFGQLITSRGCPGRCIYCASLVHGKQFRFRSADNVFNEMVCLYEKYKINHFRFQDDAFTINRERIHALCDKILNYKQCNFTWACASRLDFLEFDILKKMKEAGCVMINIGVETVSAGIMKEIKKNIPIQKTIEAINACTLLKIPVAVNLMTGFPFETKKDIQCNINFIKSIYRMNAVFNVGLVLIPYPGTEVYEKYHREFGFTEWWLNREYVSSKEKDYTPLYSSGRLGAWTLPEDPVLEKDFFKYSLDIKKSIKKFVRYKCWVSMKKQHGIILSVFVLVAYYASKYLYRINPHIEKLFMWRLFRLVQRLNKALYKIKNYNALYYSKLN